jgi:hypothetical protein
MRPIIYKLSFIALYVGKIQQQKDKEGTVRRFFVQPAMFTYASGFIKDSGRTAGLYGTHM